MEGTTNLGATALGSPGAGWIFAGIGDFQGFGTSDILFENPSLGQYMVWTMANDAISSSTTLGGPGDLYTLVSIGAYTSSGASDLMLENTQTGVISEFAVGNGSLTNNGALGTPGVFFLLRKPPTICRRRRRPQSSLRTLVASSRPGTSMRPLITAAERSVRRAPVGRWSGPAASRGPESPTSCSRTRPAASRYGRPTASQ